MRLLIQRVLVSGRKAQLTNQGPRSRPSNPASVYSEIADLMLALTFQYCTIQTYLHFKVANYLA